LRAPRKNEVVAVAPMIVDCATKIWSYSARERYHPFNTISSSPKTAQTTNHACLQRTAHQRKASHRSFQVVNNPRQETPPTETSLVSHRRNPEFLVRTLGSCWFMECALWNAGFPTPATGILSKTRWHLLTAELAPSVLDYDGVLRIICAKADQSISA
jgi:hypothetical protein